MHVARLYTGNAEGATGWQWGPGARSERLTVARPRPRRRAHQCGRRVLLASAMPCATSTAHRHSSLDSRPTARAQVERPSRPVLRPRLGQLVTQHFPQRYRSLPDDSLAGRVRRIRLQRFPSRAAVTPSAHARLRARNFAGAIGRAAKTLAPSMKTEGETVEPTQGGRAISLTLDLRMERRDSFGLGHMTARHATC
jgi:hypothetical protein